MQIKKNIIQVTRFSLFEYNTNLNSSKENFLFICIGEMNFNFSKNDLFLYLLLLREKIKNLYATILYQKTYMTYGLVHSDMRRKGLY